MILASSLNMYRFIFFLPKPCSVIATRDTHIVCGATNIKPYDLKHGVYMCYIRYRCIQILCHSLYETWTPMDYGVCGCFRDLLKIPGEGSTLPSVIDGLCDSWFLIRLSATGFNLVDGPCRINCYYNDFKIITFLVHPFFLYLLMCSRILPTRVGCSYSPACSLVIR